jgi:hypothetical protein
MNKKHLVLIAVVAVLIIVVVTVTFAQLLMQNSNKASSPSPSFPSSSTSQSLTPDEIATLKADSLELEVKDAFLNSGTFPFERLNSNIDGSAFVAQQIVQFANYTSVSQATFLNDISSYLIDKNNQLGVYGSLSLVRVDNTFYLSITRIPPSGTYSITAITVSCTP